MNKALAYIKRNINQIMQALAHHSYLFILLFLYDGDRHILHYFLIVAFALILDYALQRLYQKRPHFNISVFITCSTCYMLMVTKHLVWPYYAAVFVGIVSKYVLTVRGKHIFNPGNLGLLFALCVFSDNSMVTAGQWLGSVPMMLFFAAFGIIVSTMANRWVLSLVYISSFVILRLIKYEMSGINLYFLIGPIISVGGFIFTFHMITDPKTSPNSRWGQAIFGVSVALLDFYLRESQIIFASVLALSAICAVRAIWIEFGSEKMKDLMRETVYKPIPLPIENKEAS